MVGEYKTIQKHIYADTGTFLMIHLFDVRKSDTDLHDQNTTCLSKITKPAISVIME